MLTIKFIVYGIVMFVLSSTMIWMLLTSKEESKLTKIGFGVLSIGFFMYGVGLFMVNDPTRAIATLLLAVGVVTAGLGYDSLKAKVCHGILGLVLLVVMFTRFML